MTEPLDFDKYQADAVRSANQQLAFQDMLASAALGLSGETGEVADHIKKWISQGHELDTLFVVRELGDILWYVARMSGLLGVPLSDVAQQNVEKLLARYPDGFDAQRSIVRD